MSTLSIVRRKLWIRGASASRFWAHDIEEASAWQIRMVMDSRSLGPRGCEEVARRVQGGGRGCGEAIRHRECPWGHQEEETRRHLRWAMGEGRRKKASGKEEVDLTRSGPKARRIRASDFLKPYVLFGLRPSGLLGLRRSVCLGRLFGLRPSSLFGLRPSVCFEAFRLF